MSATPVFDAAIAEVDAKLTYHGLSTYTTVARSLRALSLALNGSDPAKVAPALEAADKALMYVPKVEGEPDVLLPIVEPGKSTNAAYIAQRSDAEATE